MPTHPDPHRADASHVSHCAPICACWKSTRGTDYNRGLIATIAGAHVTTVEAGRLAASNTTEAHHQLGLKWPGTRGARRQVAKRQSYSFAE